MGRRTKHLSQRAAIRVISSALGSHTEGWCPEPASPHACGTGIASLVSRDLMGSLTRHVNVAKSVGMEIGTESEYSKTKLLEFLLHVRDLQQDILSTAKSLAADCCAHLPGGTGMRDMLLGLSNSLEHDIVGPLQTLLLDLPEEMGWNDEHPPGARRRIRRALKKLKAHLSRLADGEQGQLAVARRWACDSVQRLDRDWRGDLTILAGCEPAVGS